MIRLLLSLVAVAACASAQAQIYKCPDASGRTVIQQMPCMDGVELDVRPASGASRAATPHTAAPQGDGTPMTAAERINAATDASQRERRRRNLEQIQVPRARDAIFDHRDQCARKVERLEDDQYRYVQNMYGKTHAAQRASERAALSAQCDTENRALVADYEALLAECQELEGCVGVR